jgi:pimeloyl-ACP methyl ester carboxylesterase
MAVQPFTIDVPDSILEDLKSRLERTRWPDGLPGTNWDYGSNLDYVKELVEYWRTKFDWRAQERLLNSFSHFKTEVDGLDIHYIHEKGKGLNPIPLVITHGWPGTFFEMYKVIPMLSDPASHGGDPADAFDIVAPSMPGYGFSGHTTERGLDVLAIGDLWAKLMSDNLGYQRFGAQGGDWGAIVTAKLGLSHSNKVIGIHSTFISRPTPYMGPGSRELSEAEKAMFQQRTDWQAAEGGYAHIQGTKPQTLS